jgi:leucyl-tRNA synthetase
LNRVFPIAGPRPFQEGGDFRDEGINGPRRFLDEEWGFVSDACREGHGQGIHHGVLVKPHQSKKRVTEGMKELRYTPPSRRWWSW